jgi:Methyltransferase domain
MAMQKALDENQACRLCDGQLRYCFSLVILKKHDVKYYECESCGSMQTEQPYWLEEAYSSHLSRLDTGAAARNIANLSMVYFIARIFNARNLIDFGGGDGLLCRMLRDRELNAYCSDKYAKPTYAQGFTEPTFKPDMTTAFEVLEHLVTPKTEFDGYFAGRPNIVLFSTEIYKPKLGREWTYFMPDTGQHIFFYSNKAFELIAKKYGYEAIVQRGYILFVKDDEFPKWKLFIARHFRNKLLTKISRFQALAAKTPGVGRDHSNLSLS